MTAQDEANELVAGWIILAKKRSRHILENGQSAEARPGRSAINRSMTRIEKRLEQLVYGQAPFVSCNGWPEDLLLFVLKTNDLRKQVEQSQAEKRTFAPPKKSTDWKTSVAQAMEKRQ